MMYHIAAIIIVLTTVVSENAFAVYGEGNYSINIEGTDKGLSSINFDVNLRGREKLISFSPILKGNINLQEKSLVLNYTKVDIFNPSVDLSIGPDIMPGVTGLTASAPQIKGIRLAYNKKLWHERITPLFFKGLSSRGGDVYGGKIDLATKAGITANTFCFKDTVAGDAIGGNLSMPLLFWKVASEQGSGIRGGTSAVGGTETAVGSFTTVGLENLPSIGVGTQTVIITNTTTTTVYPLNMSMDYQTGSFGSDGYRIGGVFKLKRVSIDGKYSLINSNQSLALNSLYSFKAASVGLGFSEASDISNWKLSTGYGTATKRGSMKINGEYSISNGQLPSNDINSWKLSTDYGTTTKLGNMQLNGEYSSSNGQVSSNDINRWKINSSFDSRRVGEIKLNTEYSVASSPWVINNASLWKLDGKFKFGKKFWIDGAFSKNNPGTSTAILGYSWNSGYKWNFSKEFSLTLTKQQSFRELIGENDRNLVNYLSTRIDFLPQFPLSVSSEIGVERIDSISKGRLKEQLSLKRNISLRYSYKGFNPWFSYNITGIDSRTINNGDINRENIVVGVKKKLTRNLTGTIQRMCQIEESQSNNRGQINSVERINTEKKVNLIYRFPNYPLNMDLEFFSKNEQKFNWKVSFTFREKNRQNYFKYMTNDMKFTEAKEFRFGASPDDMTSISKKLPDKNEFSKLGVVSISVFKDEDANRVFLASEEGLAGIKVAIFGKSETKDKAKMTMTGENGKACFVDVPAGVYNLNIDLGSVPIDFICVAELEQTIRVEAGKGVELKFPLQKAGTVKGRVFIDENRNGIWDAGETSDNDIIVYADDAPTFTESGGLYKFTNIPPSKIRVRMDKSGLQKGYVMTTPEFFDVDLKPEQEIEGINFGMAEKEVEIEFE